MNGISCHPLSFYTFTVHVKHYIIYDKLSQIKVQNITVKVQRKLHKQIALGIYIKLSVNNTLKY